MHPGRSQRCCRRLKSLRLCGAAAIHRGWNKEEDFRVSPELAAKLAGMEPGAAKHHERRERNRQSALAARTRRCAY